MGKISPVSAKYIIHAQIQIEGVVEKPDVIGSIFGQTEGLLGNDLELRELQRSGRIGRIEIEIDTKGGKTSGLITVPSSMDKTETVIVAAALETIQRIGPCNARVKVEKVEDIRISKRKLVIDRARELLHTLTFSVLPDSRDIKEEVSSAVKVMEAVEYGKERLPAGPAVEESEELIVVEGRADILNLLKNDIKNCIALNGTSVPQTVIDLSKQKTLTIFCDGDRGGDLIIKEMNMVAEVDFVCKAPDGKEVEELTKKEILKALRGKVSLEQYKHEGLNGGRREESNVRNERPMPAPVQREREERFDRRPPFARPPMQRAPFRPAPHLSKPEADSYRKMLDDLIGTRGAYILDESNNILGKVPTTELGSTLKSLSSGIHAIVLDGSITNEIVSTAAQANVKYVIGMENESTERNSKVRLITNSDLVAT